MNFAYPSQRIQDWITQQWVILWGRRIDLIKDSWLMGPFGNVDFISDSFIYQLAKEEDLDVERNQQSKGLIANIKEFGFSLSDCQKLKPEVKDFYEKTSEYELKLQLKWKPFFRVFGSLIQKLFSNRLKQLYIPTNGAELELGINSEIITLRDKTSGDVKYTVWYRVIRSSNRVMFSGIYTVCQLPSGKTCVKVIFPLPRGNATVIMESKVNEDGSLSLLSSGKGFGNAGFYFLLSDSKGGYWAQYVKGFRDLLEVSVLDSKVIANQVFTFWGRRVFEIVYDLKKVY